ncbi:MAG: YigZ family protein, partial [Alistipes sp.]
AEVIAASEIVECTVNREIRVDFSYVVMNDIMKIIKDEQPTIVEQCFDNLCTLRLSIRESRAEGLSDKLKKVEGATLVAE